MPTETYQFPNLLALLPEKPGGEINPNFKEIKAAFDAWAEKELRGSFAAEVYSYEVPLNASMVFPVASYQQLKGIVDFIAVAFLLDDVMDYGCGPSVDPAILVRLWMEALWNGSEAKGLQHPVLQMMSSEFLLGIRKAVGSFHSPQFIAANEKTIMEMVQELRDRKGSVDKITPPDIRSYIVQRRKNVGIDAAYVLVRVTRCLYIPDDVLAHPAVRELELAATDMNMIANDVYSYKKERNLGGAFGNILTVIAKDPETAHLDFQGRLDYTKELFKDALDRFNLCKRELPSFGPEMDRYLSLYSDGLIDLTTGGIQWSHVTPRYSTFTNEEDRKNNVLRLALDEPPANGNSVPVL